MSRRILSMGKKVKTESKSYLLDDQRIEVGWIKEIDE